MLTFVVGWVLVMSLGVCVGFFAMQRAPVGYEDGSGFHYGPENASQSQVHEMPGAAPAHA